MEDKDFTSAHQSSLKSFALSRAEDSLECNLLHIHACWEDLLWQMATAEDLPVLPEVMLEEEGRLNRIIEEDQAHRAWITVLSQIQLQAMEWVQALEQELRQPNAILEQM